MHMSLEWNERKANKWIGITKTVRMILKKACEEVLGENNGKQVTKTAYFFLFFVQSLKIKYSVRHGSRCRKKADTQRQEMQEDVTTYSFSSILLAFGSPKNKQTKSIYSNVRI